MDEPSSKIVQERRESPSSVEASASRSATHRVSRRETLFMIARRYGTAVAPIKQWNSLRGNVIHVGQRPVIERLSRSSPTS
jgi:LysM repeat protein